MRLTDLQRPELRSRLVLGLDLITGPFCFRIFSRQGRVLDGLHTLYGEFEIGEFGYHDFHIRIARPGGLRRSEGPGNLKRTQRQFQQKQIRA